MYTEQHKMSDLFETNFNIETGETTQRVLTKKEVDELASRQAVIDAEIAQAQLAKKAKEEILVKLGITEAEAQLLLS